MFFTNTNTGFAVGDHGTILKTTDGLSFTPETNSQESALTLVPNPVIDKFSLQLPLQFGEIVSVELFSSTGKLILKTTKTTDINITGFERGPYLVTVTNSEGEKLSARIIIK